MTVSGLHDFFGLSVTPNEGDLFIVTLQQIAELIKTIVSFKVFDKFSFAFKIIHLRSA